MGLWKTRPSVDNWLKQKLSIIKIINSVLWYSHLHMVFGRKRIKHYKTFTHIRLPILVTSLYTKRGILGTVVACWTAGQQAERAILHLGHDSYQNSSHLPRLSPAQHSLTEQNPGLKHHLCHFCTHCIIPIFSTSYINFSLFSHLRP